MLKPGDKIVCYLQRQDEYLDINRQLDEIKWDFDKSSNKKRQQLERRLQELAELERHEVEIQKEEINCFVI